MLWYALTWNTTLKIIFHQFRSNLQILLSVRGSKTKKTPVVSNFGFKSMHQRLESGLVCLLITEVREMLTWTLMLVFALDFNHKVNSLPTHRKPGMLCHRLGSVNSPPGNRVCPAKGFLGLGQINFPIGICTCACTHTEPAKASGTFATILLIIIKAELYSLRSLTCFAVLKGLLQPAQPWPVFGLHADRQPAGCGSELSDTERCRAARLSFLASWENGAASASTAKGEWAAQGTGVRRKQPGEFSLGYNEITWKLWLQQPWFRTEEQWGETGRCKDSLCLQWTVPNTWNLSLKSWRFMRTEKASPTVL